MPKKFIILPSTQTICYQISNQTSPDQQALVFVHGNFSSHGWWRQTIEGLIGIGKKIVAMDMKGFGQSTYNTKSSSFQGYAQNVIQLLTALKITKAVLIGWSFGGGVSMKLSQMRPDLITKLILTCSVSHEGLQYKDDEGKVCVTEEDFKKNPKIAGSLIALQQNNRQAMRKLYDFILYQKMKSVSQARKVQLLQDAFKQRNYVEVCQALAYPHIDINLIKAPTLVIHGSEDILLPVQTIMGTASKLGKMELWEGHGHMIPIEDTGRFVKSVANFI